MTAHQPIKSAPDRATSGRLFLLELNAGKVHVMNPDGSGKTTIVESARNPDGIAVDVGAGHIYWTNMGNPKLNDGSIERADLDGGNRVTIVPPGATFTPKQMQLEKADGKIYWSDREGMRVMRANLDGSEIETLIQTGDAETRPGPDAAKWCVGIAVDPAGGKFYWTQKGPDNGEIGLLCRANIDFPPGQDAASRTDIEVLLDHLPEPIDLEFDLENRRLYWTDRGNMFVSDLTG
jgi:DNA-binding beta-propeller fold protein YncE